MRLFLAYGVLGDPHLERVLQTLAELGAETCVFPSTNILFSNPCALSLDPSTPRLVWSNDCDVPGRFILDCAVYPSGARRQLDAGSCVVWLRNKAYFPNFETREEQESHFCLTERASWLFSWLHTRGVEYFNNRAAMRYHEDKIVQLELARAVGFKVPKTVVCNDKHEIQALANQCKDLIIKPLNTAFVPGDRHGLDSISIMTNTLSRAELNGSDETEWRQSPCIVQERIHKAFEIRLIQVGDESFAMRVPSAELEHASVDWRRAQTELTYTPLPVSDALRATAAEYLRMSKLRFGVFDLAVDAEGEVFFFECNSSGQWAWMEKEADDFAISRFVANAFYRQVGLQ